MDKFNTMLSRLGLRGSSDDDRGDLAAVAGRRSTQSTPKAGRVRLHSAGDAHAVHPQHPAPAPPLTYGSLGSMEPHLVQRRPRDRSWESERTHNFVPRGLNRTWEVERRRGMELLQQSMEREKVRRGQKQPATGRERRRKQKKRGKTPEASREPIPHVDTTRFSQERLEKRMKELNRQLLEEKQNNRRDKLTVVRLQREIARQKSDGPLRETLMQELEQERMLRMSAEQELQELAIKSNNNRSQHRALQEEYKKMEEMARTMGHYANKLEQLKREKSMITVTYESNLQKCRTHISNLEQENKLLTAEVQNLESRLQSSSSHNDLAYRVSSKLTTCSQSDGDKCKVLLERLKMLEGEKSALVLENERQRAQYEKYLDEIANQVVQALMSQKSLREECAKLQRRVIDLEYQNRQLHHMFQQRIRFASDSLLQSVPGVKSALRGCGPEGPTASNSSSSSGRQPAQARPPRLPEQGQILLHATASPFSEVSLESLQSMCSNNNEALQMEEALGKPELCSPPPWLRDKLLQGGSPTSSLSSPIPTEHASLSVAPPMKQMGQYSASGIGDETAANAIARYLAGIKPAPFPDSEGQGQLPGSHFTRHPCADVQIPSRGNLPSSFHQQLPRQDVSRTPVSELPFASSGVVKDDRSNRLLHGQFMVNRQDGLAAMSAGDKFVFATDDSGSSSPAGVNNLSSVASTVSLNELLENGLDGNNHDDFFSEDNSRFEDFSDEEHARGEGSLKQDTSDCRGSELTDVMWEEDGTVGSQVCLSGEGETGAGDGRFVPVDVSVGPDKGAPTLGCVNEYSSSESESDTNVKSRLPLTDSFDTQNNSTDTVILRQGQTLSDDSVCASNTSQQSIRTKQKPAVKPKPIMWSSPDTSKPGEVSRSDVNRQHMTGDSWKSLDQSTGHLGDSCHLGDSSQTPESFRCRFGGDTCDVATGNSPDSVMQTSYSSSSDSEIVGSDKVTSRDDGYSSNSAVSVNISKPHGSESYSKPNSRTKPESMIVGCAFREEEAVVTKTRRSPGVIDDDEYKTRSVKDIRASFEMAASSHSHVEASRSKAKREKQGPVKTSPCRRHLEDCCQLRQGNGGFFGMSYSDTYLNISSFVHTRCRRVDCRDRVMLRRSCSDGALYCHNLAFVARPQRSGSRLVPPTLPHVIGWTTAEIASSKLRETVAPPGGWDYRQVAKIGRQRGSPRSLGEGAENGYCSWENLKPQRPAAIGSEQLIDVTQRDCERRWNHHQVPVPSMHFLAEISESDGRWDRPRSVGRQCEAEVTGGLKVTERTMAWEGSLEAFEEVYQEAMSSQRPASTHSHSALTLHAPHADLGYSQGDLCSCSQGDVRHHDSGASLNTDSCKLRCVAGSTLDPQSQAVSQRQNIPHNTSNTRSELGVNSRLVSTGGQVDSGMRAPPGARVGKTLLEAKITRGPEGVCPGNPAFKGGVDETAMSRDLQAKGVVTSQSKLPIGGQRSTAASNTVIVETQKSHPSVLATTVSP